jgi:hypothetical protein
MTRCMGRLYIRRWFCCGCFLAAVFFSGGRHVILDIAIKYQVLMVYRFVCHRRCVMCSKPLRNRLSLIGMCVSGDNRVDKRLSCDRT